MGRKKSSAHYQKEFNDFMETLREMSPDELLNSYLEAKYGKNFVAEDKLPLRMFRKAEEGIEEMLEFLGPKMN